MTKEISPNKEVSINEADVSSHLIVFLSFVVHAYVLLSVFMSHNSSFELVFFALLAIIVPPVTAFSLLTAGNHSVYGQNIRKLLIQSASLCVVAVSIVFTGISFLQWAMKLSPDIWQPQLVSLITLVSFSHLLFVGFVLCQVFFARFQRPFFSPAIQFVGTLPLDRFVVLSVLLASLLLGAQMNGQFPFFGSVFSLFSELSPSAGLTISILSVVLGPAVVLLAVITARAETKNEAPDQRRDFYWLLAALCAVPIVYFDLRFNSDVLHFLTNAGPANQMLRSGGIPLVDTYSQYGLGPLLATWISFLLAGPTLHSANVMAQLHSLMLYSCILVCVYRMTVHRRSALLLGFFAISILLSGWWYGNYSLNSVPSSIGLRYFPCALVVLAISLLKRRQASSPLLVFAMTLSMLWSSEIFIGASAIVSLFILLEFARTFNFRRLAASVLYCLALPLALGFALVQAMTLIAGGQFANLVPVFEFLLVYNMTSDFWSIAASGQFFGWIAVAGLVGVALSSAWYLALANGITDERCNAADRESGSESHLDVETAVRRVAPMAGLAIVMSAYYVGRSVDFTLIIAFMPCVALFIPMFLALTSNTTGSMKSGVVLSGMLASILALFMTFSQIAVFRDGGPYRPFVAELVRGDLADARIRFQSRPMLDAVANPNFQDLSGLAAETLKAIETFAPEQDRLTLLLGKHPTTPWSVHSDMVLLLAGKGNRWPVSYVLSDELSPTRVKQILDHAPELKKGEFIFLRADEATLGPLESAILNEIRSRYKLHLEETGFSLIKVFSVVEETN